MEAKIRILGFTNGFVVPSNEKSGGLCLLWADDVELEEQLSGNVRNESQMDGFRATIQNCQLVDMGYVGCDFTWTNSREDEARKGQRFRFKKMWLQGEGCENVIQSAWAFPSARVPLFQVCEKIRTTRVALLEQQRNVFGSTRLEIAKDKAEIWQEFPDAIEHVVMDYFRKIFLSQRVLLNAMSEVTDAVVPKVTPDMNAELLKPYTKEEIKLALFQMHHSKSPGKDGMSPLFYQKFWHIVGEDVVEAVWSFLTLGRLLHEACFTHVVLIPKVNEPQDMTQLRPISLCNVAYKIGAKVLANRLILSLHIRVHLSLAD
ncbi:hypothetical protein PS1_030066 [Malus domestica]